MTNGILLINYKDGISEDAIQNLISNFYGEHSDIIGGMTYFETKSDELVQDIKSKCME